MRVFASLMRGAEVSHFLFCRCFACFFLSFFHCDIFPNVLDYCTLVLRSTGDPDGDARVAATLPRFHSTIYVSGSRFRIVAHAVLNIRHRLSSDTPPI